MLTSASAGSRRRRSRRSRGIKPYSWLGTGAVAIGIGAAALAGAGVAGADDTAESAPSEPSGKVERTSTASTSSAQADAGADEADVDSAEDDAHSKPDSPDDSDAESQGSDQPTGGGGTDRSDRNPNGGSASLTSESDVTGEHDQLPEAPESAGELPTEMGDELDGSTVEPVVGERDTPSMTVKSPQYVSHNMQPAAAEATAPATTNLTPITRVFATLESTLPGGPAAPAESPLGWLLLAAARRPLEGRTSTDVSFVAAAANVAPTASLSKTSSPGWFTAKVTGSVKAIDSDGDSLTYAVTPAAHGTVSVDSRGRFTYTPTAAGRHGAAATNTGAAKTDTFTITVSDGAGGVATVPVTVSIRPANTAPTRLKATAGQPNPADGRVAGAITAVDPDGDILTYTATNPKNGVVTINPNGTFTYAPSAAARSRARSTFFSDSDTFKVTVNDGHGGTKSVTVRVTIAPSNSAPTAGRPTISAPNAATGTVTGSVNAVDAEGGNITYVADSLQTGRGTFTMNERGEFSYTPTALARHAAAANAQAAVTDSVIITARDNAGVEGLITVVLPIAPANSAPRQASNPPLTVPDPSTGAIRGLVDVTDSDGDALTYTTTAPAKGTVVLDASGHFVYTPIAAARHRVTADDATGADAQDRFTVTVTDGHGGRLDVTVMVSIAASPNAAPANPTSTTATNASSGVVTGSVTATDADNDELTYSGSATTAKGTVVIGGDGRFTYTPTEASRLKAGEPGADAASKSDSFTVTINDGHGAIITVPISVSVVPIIVNQPPAAGTPVVGRPDPRTGAVTGSLNFTDPDDATLTYTVIKDAMAGSVTLTASGGFTYAPTAELRPNVGGAPASDSFTVLATDSDGRAAQVTVSVPVAPIAAATPGAVRRDPTTGRVAVKAAHSTTAYEWVGFNPQTGSYPETNADVVDWVDVWEPGSSTAGLSTGLSSYAAGSVKIDPNSSLIAMKSVDDFGPGEWFVFDPVNGGFYATSTWVGRWLDVYVAPSAGTAV